MKMFSLRLLPSVRDAVVSRARQNRRSATAEVLHMLNTEPDGSLPEGVFHVVGRGAAQINVRMPSDVHEYITAAASTSGRSANSEMAYRIASALRAGDQPVAGTPTSLNASLDRAEVIRRRGGVLVLHLTEPQQESLARISAYGPYTIALTDIVSRGIDLAVAEIEAMAKGRA